MNIKLSLAYCCGKNVYQREQDSSPGGWRKGRFIMLAGQYPGSPEMALACSSRLWDFYASEFGSKQVGRTKADVAVSFSLGGYNVSH
jgi:hypothetical protein